MKKNIFGWRLEFYGDPTYVGDIFVEGGEDDDEVPKSSHPPIRITRELLARAKTLAALTDDLSPAFLQEYLGVGYPTAQTLVETLRKEREAFDRQQMALAVECGRRVSRSFAKLLKTIQEAIAEGDDDALLGCFGRLSPAELESQFKMFPFGEDIEQYIRNILKRKDCTKKPGTSSAVA